jgi:chromate reductase
MVPSADEGGGPGNRGRRASASPKRHLEDRLTDRMAGSVRIVGIPGSLRAESFNRKLLLAAQELLPSETSLELFELAGIPPFNEDEEKEPPARVRALKTAVRSADAVLFGVPEYNYGVAGVLKNAIDWGSRPYAENCWSGKPVACVSASVGMLGGARAVYHLRQSFVFLNMRPINLPEVFVPFAPQKFDAAGRFTDETGRKTLASLLVELVRWTRQLRGDAAGAP